VVIVTATDGRMGNDTVSNRMDELRPSARILGAHRVEWLGYADSGYGPIFYLAAGHRRGISLAKEFER
jgi:LmbE family N-acetylglucosaminyl deacetylase